MIYLTVDGMFGGTGVRDSVEGGYVDLDTLELSPNLVQKIQSWLDRYEAAHFTRFKDARMVADLDREGLAIRCALQGELPSAKIEYYSNALMSKITVPRD